MASMEMSSPETPNSRTKIAMERPAIIGKRKTMPERQSAISKKKAMVEKNFGQPKRRPSMDKPNTKGRAGPSLHSVRSLSGDYRFTGGSLLVEKEEAVNLTIVEEEKDGIDVGGKSEMSNLQSYMEEEGVNVCALAEEDFVGFKVNNESPYSSISTDTDERPLPGDESSLDSSASWWPRNFLSQTNSRWSDTSSYGAKKILISGSLESFDVDDLCFNAHYSGGHEQGCDVYNHLSLFLCFANHDKLLLGWIHFARFTIVVVNKDPENTKYSGLVSVLLRCLRSCLPERGSLSSSTLVVCIFCSAPVLFCAPVVACFGSGPRHPFAPVGFCPGRLYLLRL